MRDLEPRQPRRFGLLGNGRRRKKAGAIRGTARPVAVPHQARHPRAEERAELAVLIDASARRYREPTGDINVILDEDARHRERVGKLRKVNRPERIALDGQPADNGVAAERSPCGELGKAGLVLIALGDLTVLMILS